MNRREISSYRHFPNFLVSTFCLMALATLSGCASAEMPATGATPRADSPRINQMAQVIIKFKDPALDPSRLEVLKGLLREPGVTLVYVRPMSGAAHVLQIQGVVDPDHFQRIVEELANKPGVEYAEADRLMRTMPQY